MACSSAWLTSGVLLLLLYVCLTALAVALMLVARAGPRVATSLLLLLSFAQGMRVLGRAAPCAGAAASPRWRCCWCARSVMLRVLAALAGARRLAAPGRAQHDCCSTELAFHLDAAGLRRLALRGVVRPGGHAAAADASDVRPGFRPLLLVRRT